MVNVDWRHFLYFHESNHRRHYSQNYSIILKMMYQMSSLVHIFIRVIIENIYIIVILLSLYI